MDKFVKGATKKVQVHKKMSVAAREKMKNFTVKPPALPQNVNPSPDNSRLNPGSPMQNYRNPDQLDPKVSCFQVKNSENGSPEKLKSSWLDKSL